MYRRRLLGAVAASGAVAAAGCLGGEDGTYEFDAEPARVPDAALSEAGYEGEGPQSFEIEQTFEVAGIEGRVSATSWVASYENPERASSLLVASTPNATVAGQSVNPLVRADGAELLRRLLEQGGSGGVDGGSVGDLEEVGTETRTILESETTVTTFATEIRFEDVGDAPVDTEGSVPALIHVATVEHGEDVLVLVGVHPRAIEEGETQGALMEAVEH
ncbi:DUF6517 family protein [Halorubrum cibi]|uniref:Uncharacterized protein n=1 Tax=Halorubrum cibi TaxID=413815 RepID=A0A521EIV1_9EURY|nr:DUF6517 family protein [Halorubrum cibi]SMO83853.1 hypothetical protein SAMN06264867_11127 [Halorubrum cibi]